MHAARITWPDVVMTPPFGIPNGGVITTDDSGGDDA
jgi:hypothetical protein